MSKRSDVRAVFDTLIPLLNRGDTELVDLCLAAVDPEQVEDHVSIAHLAITVTAKGVLRERAALVQRVHQHLMRTRPDRVEALLRGIK